ncbi:MAG: AMP-binding protein [Candidatus Dormibacteraeota bacterium]|nr:AMP-binding protein [Candidatus Dormibacteraeota bacterium]MBO0761728.1 AMP-binding protein [Candidatus Dormibacteraeota bacterium]
MGTARPRSRHYADLLDEIVARHPDREALVFESRRLTYRQLVEEAARVARGLHGLGVRPGDRVAAILSNRLEWPVLAFGAFQLGATFVPLSTWYRAWDLDHAIRHCRAQFLVTMEAFRGNRYVDALCELAPELPAQTREHLSLERFPDLRRLVVLGASSTLPSAYTWDELLDLGEGVPDAALAECREAASPEDLAYLLYTSGSTAAPKGVMVQHAGCCENGFDIGERLHLTHEDRVWLVVPMAWALGSQNAMSAIVTHGACMVLQEHMEAGAALQLLSRERVTAIYSTANIVTALCEHPDHGTADLSALRTAATSGHPEEIRRAIEELAAPEACNIYGATETYGNCCVTDAWDPVEIKLQSQGRPLPGMELRVMDPETGAWLAPGETGEVLVRGHIVPGYWDDPENTAAAFRDGYYYTGDLGYLDERGFFHFVSRRKELIKTGGINVAPAEVEAFLTEHPEVKEAYVVGVPDPVKDEAVAAVVQRKAGTTLAAGDLLAYCRSRIAGFKIPERFVFVEEEQVPRTSTGKVNKRELLHLLEAEPERA